MQLKKKRNTSITAIVLVALAGTIIGVGVYGCKKEEPEKEDTLKSVSLGDRLHEQTKIAFVSKKDRKDGSSGR